MYEKPQFEIPETVRELAERNVEQARSAYTVHGHGAPGAVVSKSQGAMTQSALEIQSRAMRYAEQNIDASFAFASISPARATARVPRGAAALGAAADAELRAAGPGSWTHDGRGGAEIAAEDLTAALRERECARRQ